MATPPILEVTDLNVGYGKVGVVRELSIRLRAGECVALLGANGAGKSTLLKSVAGALPASSGTVRVKGIEMRGKPAHELLKSGVSLVPEGRHVFGAMSVADNLQLGSLRLSGRRSHYADQLGMVYALFPRLRERATQMAGTLSGGEQQMLAIGRALMAGPSVLLLDEPFMGLAPLVVEEIMAAITRLAAQGVAILVVEQKTAQIFDICSHVYVLAKGRIVFDAPADQVLREGGISDVYFGTGEVSAPSN